MAVIREILLERGSVYGDQNAWSKLEETINELKPSKIFVLTDTNTREHCLPILKEYYGVTVFHVLQINEGESHKNIHTCLKLWEELSEAGADRSSLLINLGGGVVTDLGGFVACTFRRGIEFINIPTSLLAMVDASIGGKNGVDLGALKNQVGIIKQPKMVLVDSLFLKTLPAAHFNSGVAEMLKHGLITKEDYWDRVVKMDSGDEILVSELIWDSIEIKNHVVQEDPFEKGLRKTLNYGHTLGHAIESYCLDNSEKASLLHGEAIAIGMILATYISAKTLAFPEDKLQKVALNILDRYQKLSFSKGDIDNIIKLLIFDKKNVNGKIYFVLLSEFGKHKTNCEVSNYHIHEAFDNYKNL